MAPSCTTDGKLPVMEFGLMVYGFGIANGTGASASVTSCALPLPLPALPPLSGGPAACGRGQGISLA